MNELPANLFPHSHLSESSLREILSFFGPITIFQPWFMERPAFVLETEDLNLVRLLNPPLDLKPGKGFRSLLSEYKNWMKRNRDRSYTAFLKANQKMESAENATWEIRQELRRINQNTPAPEEDRSFGWHLVLHLAGEIEDQYQEADRMLKLLKEKRSPLRGIVEEEEDVRSLFEDLPRFEPETVTGEYRLELVFEAWFALFGGYLKGHELLLTLSPRVMDHVSELWEEAGIETGGQQEEMVSFKCPDLSEHPLDGLIEIKRKSFKQDKIKELRRLILNFWENPTGNFVTLERLSKEIEVSRPWEFSAGALNITAKFLIAPSNNDPLQTNRVLRDLSGKTIILVEHESRYE